MTTTTIYNCHYATCIAYVIHETVLYSYTVLEKGHRKIVTQCYIWWEGSSDKMFGII